MYRILIAVVLVLTGTAVSSAAVDVNTYIPRNAVPLLPALAETIDQLWPEMPLRSALAAQIETESCISLTHSRCWNSRSELKTQREYGFGFGQTTVAYNADGSERFNVWKDLRAKDLVLKDAWTWENRYDPRMQMRAMLVLNRQNWSAIRFPVADTHNRLAFMFVWYNSGSPLIDRNLCVHLQGCDPSKWFGNVELYTRKSVIKQKGYGKSFAEISREYPRSILYIRRNKYVPYMDLPRK